jgi:urease accessory protein
VDGASAIVACAAASPLQLLSPSPRGRCAWIIPASHGGGLLAGDDVSLEVDVGDGAVALLSTQAGTKVYRSPGRVATQRLDARVGRDAVLAVLPHPVSCFTLLICLNSGGCLASSQIKIQTRINKFISSRL